MLINGGEDQFAISTFPDFSVKKYFAPGVARRAEAANKHIIALGMFRLLIRF